MYAILRDRVSKYITNEKLTECCHEFDTNVNGSINNIVIKYTPTTKNHGNSIELRTKVCIASLHRKPEKNNY